MDGNLFYHLKAAADLLMPRECKVCGRRLLLREEHLCIWCRDSLPLTHFWRQERNPMGDRFNDMIQQKIESGEVSAAAYARATGLFYYSTRSAYANITRRLKYHADLASGRYFGDMLGRLMVSSGALGKADVLVPVPLHWTRRWKRGYNQAEVIARAMARTAGCVLMPGLLVRPHRTGSQTKLKIEEKAKNVEGAFAVDRRVLEDLASEHVIIVDDVFTTGATLCACWKALHEARPQLRISIATLGFVG